MYTRQMVALKEENTLEAKANMVEKFIYYYMLAAN